MESQNSKIILKNKKSKHGMIWGGLLVSMFFLLLGEVLSSKYTTNFFSFSSYFILPLAFSLAAFIFAAYGYDLKLKHNNENSWRIVIFILLIPFIMLVVSAMLYGVVSILIKGCFC